MNSGAGGGGERMCVFECERNKVRGERELERGSQRESQREKEKMEAEKVVMKRTKT